MNYYLDTSAMFKQYVDENVDFRLGLHSLYTRQNTSPDKERIAKKSENPPDPRSTDQNTSPDKEGIAIYQRNHHRAHRQQLQRTFSMRSSSSYPQRAIRFKRGVR